AASHGDAAFLVDDEEVPADALVDAVDAQLELLAAARSDGGGVAACAARCGGGGGDAVFEPPAILRKVREDLPVVDFRRIEIAVRDGQHPFAAAALLGR